MEDRGCIDANTLTAFFAGDLAGTQLHDVEEHLGICLDCRLVLGVIGLESNRPPKSVGRYEVLGMLGQGGMGVVYLARDPTLGRHVALKLVRPDAERDRDLRARLLREAQAMAKVSHPNVATVLDVGTIDDEIFVALEYVEGTTLEGWIRARARPWREVLDLVIAAGRGLAAAHEAGVIHRDFKPANVLIGRDGRPRVADFGLARGAAGPGAQPPTIDDAPTENGRPPVDASPTTRTGALVGSPAYMAPEQLARRVADELSDQFSFAVTLYEALYRQRPFAAATISQLGDAIARGPLAPPVRSEVPRGVHRIVQRALRAERTARYASMTELLRALERERRPRRGIALTIAVGVAALGAGAGAMWLRAQDGDPTCRGLDDQIAQVWNAPRRDAVRAALLATNVSYASSTADVVVRRLDDYSHAWVATRTDACKATHVRGDQSDRELDRRMRCLDRQRGELDALVRSLVRVDAKSVAKAIDATQALPDVTACTDDYAGQPTTDPRHAGWLAQLAEARSADVLGRFDDSYELASRVLAAAREAGARAVEAEALLMAGEASAHLGESARGDGELRDAALVAEAVHLDEVAARARIQRIKTAVEQHHMEQARELVLAARAAVERVGSGPRLQQQLATLEGIVLARDGKLEEARKRFQAAVDLAREHDPDRMATPLNNLGGVQLELGKLDEALASYEQAITLRVATLGQRHPAVGTARMNLGAVLASLGRNEQALEQLRASLAILEPALGREHPHIARVLAETAIVLTEVGKQTEALESLRRALAIEERIGRDRPEVAHVLSVIADVLADLGRHEDALVEYRRTLELREKLLGPDHPHVGQVLNNMGNTLLALNRLAEARAAFERAIAIKTKALGETAPNLMPSLVGLAEVELARGKPANAIAPLERAEKLLAASGDPAHRKKIDELLARARTAKR